MASSKAHYEQVLSSVYSWMYGGFPAALQRNIDFFEANEISPRKSRNAIDLGAGCGFQSIPLARLGYAVTSFDLDRNLLRELTEHSKGLSINTVEVDLLRFRDYVNADVELAVCMMDTLLHLESREDARRLMADVFSALEDGGKFIITFRDLTHELTNLDRFIPVRSDATKVFTCFLEYEPETVKVHDLVYRKAGSSWELAKSFYRKLRISEQWVTGELTKAGFMDINSNNEKGLVTVVATKAE